MTIRELIISLLKHENLNDEVILRDKDGNEIHDITICARDTRLDALFG